MITQYNMNRGLLEFVYRGTADVEKEVIQLLTMDSTKMYDSKDLSKEYRRASLGYLFPSRENVT